MKNTNAVITLVLVSFFVGRNLRQKTVRDLVPLGTLKSTISRRAGQSTSPPVVDQLEQEEKIEDDAPMVQ
ncbi:hypothetical protein J6590_011188 [Homalodisca vitripennis]|nr:hypothetical protein J6590_011188 [Homalodisca vitripennis]